MLLAFYDFPAEHWDDLRTSNPIENVLSSGSSQEGSDEGISFVGNRQTGAVQAGRARLQNLPAFERRTAIAESH
jgi:hypothetical protein